MNTNLDKANKRKRGRPTQERSLDKGLLLRTALSVFAEFGYEGTSVRVIADRLGIDDSLIFYHFKNKKNLWIESVSFISDMYEEGAKNTVKLCKDQSMIDLGKALTRHLIYFMASHGDLYKVLVHEITQKSERTDWVIDNIFKPLDERTRPVIAAYEKAGYTINMPIHNYLSYHLGILNYFFITENINKKLYGVDVFNKEEVERHADFAIELIYGSIFQKSS